LSNVLTFLANLPAHGVGRRVFNSKSVKGGARRHRRGGMGRRARVIWLQVRKGSGKQNGDGRPGVSKVSVWLNGSSTGARDRRGMIRGSS